MMLKKRIIIVAIVLVLPLAFLVYRVAPSNKPNNPPIQQKTETIKEPYVTINGKTFTVELAKTPAEQQKGLGDRDSLPQDHGMLFLFNKSQTLRFWMKDMRFPLDIIFIRDDHIISITEDVPPPTSQNAALPVYQSEEPSDKVLEINAGLAKKYHIKKGDKMQIAIDLEE